MISLGPMGCFKTSYSTESGRCNCKKTNQLNKLSNDLTFFKLEVHPSAAKEHMVENVHLKQQRI